MQSSFKNLPSIRDIITKHKIQPNKKLGQNFILDTDLTDKIAMLNGDLEHFNILEIGPGVGTLTRSLLNTNAQKIFAVEIDQTCLNILNQLKDVTDNRLQIESLDALKIDEKIFPQPLKIIANLPYNIGTQLILKWLSNIHLFDSITVMLQKEVIDRIVAKPNTHAWGRFSVLCQFLCRVEKHFDVEPYHFFPPPKVVSSIVTLRPLIKPAYDCDINKLQKVTQLLFSQRRKMIRSVLKGHYSQSALNEIGIDGKLRPENLNLKQICDLANI